MGIHTNIQKPGRVILSFPALRAIAWRGERAEDGHGKGSTTSDSGTLHSLWGRHGREGLIADGKYRDRPSAFCDGSELHEIAPRAKLHVIFAADGDAVIGVLLRVQGEGAGGNALHAEGWTVVVDLDEVIRIAGSLAGAFQMGLTNYFNSYFRFLLFLSFLKQVAPFE